MYLLYFFNNKTKQDEKKTIPVLKKMDLIKYINKHKYISKTHCIYGKPLSS